MKSTKSTDWKSLKILATKKKSFSCSFELSLSVVMIQQYNISLNFVSMKEMWFMINDFGWNFKNLENKNLTVHFISAFNDWALFPYNFASIAMLTVFCHYNFEGHNIIIIIVIPRIVSDMYFFLRLCSRRFC